MALNSAGQGSGSPQSFKQINWSSGTQIASVGGSEGARQARLVFDQTGLPSAPVILSLRNDDAALALNVSASGDVSLGQ
jgi:hypothetical protein